MIPKIFHFIWIGDESKRPDNCIQTWRDQHPDWEFRIWGNPELTTRPWVNHAHIEAMLPREFNGVADMMRWEILHEHGGVLFDADSVCVRPLDDDMLDCEAFACWENEIVRPGLLAAGYFGCTPGNPFVAKIIADIVAAPSVIEDMAWKTVGPQRLTECYRKFAYSQLRIHPSHYFIPRHFTGQEYAGTGPVYAHQLWGSTLKTYDKLHSAEIEFGQSTRRSQWQPNPRRRRPPSHQPRPPRHARPALRSNASACALFRPARRSRHRTDEPVSTGSQVFANALRGQARPACRLRRLADHRSARPRCMSRLEQHCVQCLTGSTFMREALDQLRPHVSGAAVQRISRRSDRRL